MVRFTPKPYTIQEAVCSTAVKTAYDIGARIIIVITETGAIARMVAKYRPKHMILALCVQFSVIRNLNLTWGIQTLRIASNIGTENIINDAIRYSVSKGYAEKGDQIVCLLGQNEETPENVNLMKIAICE
jgi:pyruvate kinase